MLFTAFCFWGASVQAESEVLPPHSPAPPPATGNPPTPAAKAADTLPNSNQPPATTLSPMVIEVLRMAAADVTTPVLKTYVECSPMAYQMSESDVIALKQARVADEVVTVLLQRGAEIRAAFYSARKQAAARAATPPPAPSGLDLESYEYFQFYHLQSRTLATVSQNFAPGYGYGPAFAYGYPYGRPPGYGPRPGFRSGWHR